MDVRKRRQERRQAALLSSAAAASEGGVVKPPLEEEVEADLDFLITSYIGNKKLWNRKTTFRLKL